jgi:tetratricopeptide (TPR) repeat protein
LATSEIELTVFCRACWANIPDASTECPRCHANPGGSSEPAAPAPAATADRTARAPAPREFQPPPKTGDRQNRLIVLVATLLLVLVAGPKAVEWVGAWLRSADEPPATGPVAPPRPLARAPEPTAEPAGPDTGTGPDVELLREAYALYQQGKLAEACERYRDAVNRGGSGQARKSLGACLARLGRAADQAELAAQAVDYYQRSLEANADDRAVWIALAVAHARARDFSRAQQVLEQASQRFPDDPDLLYQLAEGQERQGRTKDAVETLRRLMARHPSYAAGRTLLASLEKEQKVEGQYWSQETRHFVVRFEGAGALDVGRSVTDNLEEAYDHVGRALDHFPADRLQVSIYTEEVLGQVHRIPAHFVRGLFAPDIRRIRLNLSQSVAYTNDLSHLVRHEYTHAVIHDVSRGTAPIWVHEGLAQVMEGRPRYGLDISVPREHLTVRGIERLGRTGDPMAFTAGYILMHVAMEHVVDRGGMGGVANFLRRLAQGRSVDQALKEATGLTIEDVEARLRAAAGVS